MAEKMTGKGKIGYLILAILFIGSFSLLLSQRVESKTQAAILFDNSAYEEGEHQYKEMVKAVLEAHECYHSGLNLTRTVELTGEREYQMEIHNGQFAMISGEEMEQITQEIRALTIVAPGEDDIGVEVIFSGDNL